jgi:hypothetical protein
MSPKLSVSKCLSACGLALLVSTSAWGQNYVLPVGEEFSVTGPLAGDQVHPALLLGSTYGLVAWDDNAIDKNGQGIGVSKLDLQTFRKTTVNAVNKISTFDQLNPALARLNNGLTIFTWECKGDIYSRVLRNNSFITGDVRVNTYTKDEQVGPAVIGLADGSGLIAWSSQGQDGNMWGVFARKITASGKLSGGTEFCLNQTTAYNQQKPALASLANGNFVAVWVADAQRASDSVDICGRIFDVKGKPVSGEFICNSGTNFCDTPAIAALPNGGFTVVWSSKDRSVLTNGIDIAARSFNAAGAADAPEFVVNSFLYGDQYFPKIASGSTGCLVVWTSLGQDGSREGIFGRFLLGGTAVAGDEIIVNSTTASRQLYPTVAWNGTDKFLVVWSSPVVDSGFDLFGQSYMLNPAP